MFEKVIYSHNIAQSSKVEEKMIRNKKFWINKVNIVKFVKFICAIFLLTLEKCEFLNVR